MAQILIIDDDASVRLTLRSALESVGHVVTEAADGNDGIERFIAEPSDMVITDILMPNKEGLETIMNLRKINRNLRIIAISGGGRIKAVDFLEAASDLGADAVLKKPFHMADLLGIGTSCLATTK